jgi:hypothetical protein
LAASVVLGAWWIVAPQTPDLAAQAYRLALFQRRGFVLWDNSWYAGHAVPAYSLIWPWVGSWLGLRASGVVAVLASALLFERLARALYGPGSAWAAVWFGVAAAGDAWIGRLTFALGVTFALASALAAVTAVRRTQRDGRLATAAGLAAAGLAALSAATSPVAGVLVVFGAVCWVAGAQTLGDARARTRRVWTLAVAPLVVIAVLGVLFPEGGFEPYAASSLAAALAVTVAFVVALPKGARQLRVAGCLYLLANLAAEIPTPMGSNVQRYGVLLSGPLLLCALYGQSAGTDPAPAGDSRRGLTAGRLPAVATVAMLAGMGFWVLWGPVVQSLGVAGDPSTRASFYAPVERFLALHATGPVRIEVPFTRSHWEAAYLAPHVELARGWERQLDKRYDGVLESGSLTPARYRAWLAHDAVRYVALPDVPFDQSSDAEVRLIRSGLPYLREELHTAHWRIFEVLGAGPLVEALTGGGPLRLGGAGSAKGAPAPSTAPATPAARLTSLGVDSFVLASGAGDFLVRVHYSPYWTVTAGAASVGQGPDGFTAVRVLRAGRVVVATRFSLAAVGRAVADAL